jgi:hypothetical protein
VGGVEGEKDMQISKAMIPSQPKETLKWEEIEYIRIGVVRGEPL